MAQYTYIRKFSKKCISIVVFETVAFYLNIMMIQMTVTYSLSSDYFLRTIIGRKRWNGWQCADANLMFFKHTPHTLLYIGVLVAVLKAFNGCNERMGSSLCIHFVAEFSIVNFA